MKATAILHYASAPTIGGVEATITHHARGLTRLGYPVRVVSGRGEPFPPEDNIEYYRHAWFDSGHSDILALKKALDAGQVPSNFDAMVERIMAELRSALAGCEVCIAHNVPSLNKNLALSVALENLSNDGFIRVIAWSHDLAATNPQYQPELHPGEPWDVLRRRWRDVTYVTVSEARREELAALLHMPPEDIHVVTPGVDAASMLGWTPLLRELDQRLNLLDADGLLLLPARLTRRKNIALALRILAAMREQSGGDYRLIVTGPPGPHNPANPGYLGELLELRRDLNLMDSAHFLYECGEGDQPLLVDDATIAALYRTCDALLFPSEQEGFGMPVIEAGIVGLPVFCASITPLQRTGGADARYFDPKDANPTIVAGDILNFFETDASHRLKVRARRHFRWEALIERQIVPLVEGK
jgi:glycosyltransferase involved in cell wall biosynthesis